MSLTEGKWWFQSVAGGVIGSIGALVSALWGNYGLAIFFGIIAAIGWSAVYYLVKAPA